MTGQVAVYMAHRGWYNIIVEMQKLENLEAGGQAWCHKAASARAVRRVQTQPN